MSTVSRLRRTVGTTMLTLYGIGNIVGAGVYVLVGKIAEPAGYLAVLAFLLAALVAFCAALSYAELAARFPVSAGIAVYLHEAFKAKRLSTVIGLLLVLAGTISTATLLKGFSGYFTHFVSVDPRLVIALAVVALLAVMLRGIKESVGTAAILTIIEVGGLLFLMAAILIAEPGALAAYGGSFSHAIGTVDAAALAGILAAALIAFYAFIGFEDMVNIAEEVKRPQHAYPKAILAAMACVTVLYVAVAAVTLGVLTPRALSESSAPLADAYATATGQSPALIIGVSLVATLNGVIVNVVMGSRFLYGLASRGWIPSWFGGVSKRHVPARGLVVVGVGAALCAFLLPIEQLAQATSLLLLVVFLAVNISLIVIRRRHSVTSREIRISPHFVPWVGAVASGLLLAGQVVLFVKG
ncbi:MAG TPA: amino acid permease [Candidatus Saccharimonadales bacterium]|nr:amino acid permease [Candidatus Saccharimonadales bacterium]